MLKLFQVPSDDFQMYRVETVAFRSVDDWDLIKVLWSVGVKISFYVFILRTEIKSYII